MGGPSDDSFETLLMEAKPMRVRALILGSILAAGAAIPTAASAAQPISSPPSCSVVTFNVTTLSCLGFYSGNLIADSGPKLTDALGHVDDLDPKATSLIEKYNWVDGMDPNTINFDTVLSGKTVIGIHFGGGSQGYNGTGFWLLDLPANTDKISYTSTVQQGVSNAGLYLTSQPQTPAVPEPAVWATMLLGFGLVGGLMRRLKGVSKLFPALES